MEKVPLNLVLRKSSIASFNILKLYKLNQKRWNKTRDFHFQPRTSNKDKSGPVVLGKTHPKSPPSELYPLQAGPVICDQPTESSKSEGILQTETQSVDFEFSLSKLLLLSLALKSWPSNSQRPCPKSVGNNMWSSRSREQPRMRGSKQTGHLQLQGAEKLLFCQNHTSVDKNSKVQNYRSLQTP